MFNFWCTRPLKTPSIISTASQESNEAFEQPSVSDSSQSPTWDVDQVSEDDTSEERVHRGRHYRGKYNYASLSPRARSARQRGLAAPEIRTSVSPDRILRRRRTLHRLGPRPDPPDIIDVCSDCEESSSAEERMNVHPSHTQSSAMSSQPSTQSSSATLVTRPVVFIDLTRIPSASPRRRASATTSSQAPIPRSQSAETSSSARSTVRPQWLEDAIKAVEDEFSRARFVVSAQGMLLTGRPENWELMCNECDEYVVILAGPGQSLDAFVDHLKNTHPHLRRNRPATESGRVLKTYANRRNAVHAELPRSHLTQREPTPAISSNGSSQRTPQASPAPRTETDVVEAFLMEHGLGLDVLPILRDVGITDLARMRALGRLPEHYLDRLEGGLMERGLDFAACLLVRDGLRRLASEDAN